MSWRDRIDEALEGSFRGVSFYVMQAERQPGRRVVVHEYPLRDRPYVEDLGRKARVWRVEVFVAGEDYDLQREQLVEALDRKGPGTLVHPFVGTLRASVRDARVVESTRELGMARFSIEFVEAGELELPARTVDTRRAVKSAAEGLERSLIRDFSRRWSVSGLAGWSLAAVERDLSRALQELEEAVEGVAGDIAAEIRAPANMAGMVVGSFNRLGASITEPLRAIRLYKELANGSEEPEVDGRTFERRQRQENALALQQLLGRAAAAAAARACADAEWVSRDDALAAQQDVLDLIDGQVETSSPVDDDVYEACRQLRLRVSEDLRRRATALPGLIRHTPSTTLPAIVIAHRLYGDAGREAEIVARNGIRHPGAVRGGTELEVLSD